MNEIESIKAKAGRLKDYLGTIGAPVSHSQALHALAYAEGHKNWNTYSALLQKSSPAEAPVIQAAAPTAPDTYVLETYFEVDDVVLKEVLRFTTEVDRIHAEFALKQQAEKQLDGLLRAYRRYELLDGQVTDAPAYLRAPRIHALVPAKLAVTVKNGRRKEKPVVHDGYVDIVNGDVLGIPNVAGTIWLQELYIPSLRCFCAHEAMRWHGEYGDELAICQDQLKTIQYAAHLPQRLAVLKETMA